MTGRKTIVIKKRPAGLKFKPSNSVYAEESPAVVQPSTRPLGPVDPNVATTVSMREQLQAPPVFKFYCYRCGQKLAAQVDWAGREVTCATCGKKIVVPEPPEK